MLWFCRKFSVKPEASQQNFVLYHDCAFFSLFVLRFLFFRNIVYPLSFILTKKFFFLACKCGIEKTKRIVGGTEVNPVRPYNFLLLNQLSIIFSSKVNKYPWMVLLKVVFGNGWSMCGGTLVASRYVITAAHCVEFKEIDVTPDMIEVWHISNLFLQNKDIEIV